MPMTNKESEDFIYNCFKASSIELLISTLKEVASVKVYNESLSIGVPSQWSEDALTPRYPKYEFKLINK